MLLRLIIILLIVASAGVVLPAYAQEKPSFDESFLLLMAARNALKAGDYAKAIHRYEQVIQKYPHLSEARTEYGWLLIEAGRPREALVQFETAAKANPQNRDAQYNYLRALLSLRHFKQADHVVHTLLSQKPDDEKARLFQAELHLLRMRYHSAALIYRNLLRTASDKQARMGLADVHTALGDHAGAGEILKQLRADYPADPEVLTRWTTHLANRGNLIEAYSALNHIHSPLLRKRVEAELTSISGQYFTAEKRFQELHRPRSLDYTLSSGLAGAYLGQEDQERAAAIYQSMLKHYPEDVRTRLDLADTFMLQRRYPEAEELLQRTLQEVPESVEARYLAIRLTTLQYKDDQPALSLNQLLDAPMTLPEVKALQSRMMRHRDYDGLISLSEHFIAKETYDQALLANYFNALIKKGMMKKGEDFITDRLAKDPGNSFLKISLAEFLWVEGEKERALELLRQAEDSLEKAAMYYRLGAYEDSRRVYADILKREPTNAQALLGLVKAHCALGEDDQARQVLAAFIDKTPPKGHAALALSLSMVPDGHDAYYELVDEFVKKLTTEDPDNVDVQLAQLTLYRQQGRHEEAIAGYEAIEKTLPDRPLITLQEARLMAQNRYDDAPSVYDEYLGMKPYDLTAWREKARFYGWMFEMDRAREEYAAIRAKHPDHVETSLEEEAKNSFWRGRYRSAKRAYLNLLEREPDNGEGHYDLGQIDSARLLPDEAQQQYRRLLVLMPGHRRAARSLYLSELYQRPQVTVGYGYVNLRGFDDSLLTKYRPLTVESNVALTDRLLGGVGYQYVEFDFNGAPSNSQVFRVSSRYAFNEYMHADGFVSHQDYSDIDQQNMNYGVGLSYEFFSGAKTRFDIGRQDLWQNQQTVLRNIYFDRLSAGVEYDLTPRIDVSAGAGYWNYSDNNSNVNGQLAASYKFLQFPQPLRLMYNLDTFAFRRESVYFSPDFFAKHTLTLEFSHFLGFPKHGEHLAEAPMMNRHSMVGMQQFLGSPYLGWPTRQEYLPQALKNGYSLQYGIAVDNFSNFYNQWIAMGSHTVTERCTVNVSALVIRSNVVKEDFVNGFLQCHL